MTYTRWSREMYLKLDAMVQKKASPGDMAVAMKCDKKDLSYRLHLLKTQTNIATWTEDELDLLEHAKNIDEYLRGCIEKFGKHRDKNIFIAHWKDREKYLSAWYKEKNERKKVHEIAIANKIQIQPRLEDPRKDQFPDIGDQMATLINEEKLIREILTTISEREVACIEAIREILQVQKDTYALFKGKLEPAKPNGEPKKEGS